MSVARHACRDDPPSEHVNGSEQSRRAVALVVVRHGPASPGNDPQSEVLAGDAGLAHGNDALGVEAIPQGLRVRRGASCLDGSIPRAALGRLSSICRGHSAWNRPAPDLIDLARCPYPSRSVAELCPVTPARNQSTPICVPPRLIASAVVSRSQIRADSSLPGTTRRENFSPSSADRAVRLAERLFQA